MQPPCPTISVCHSRASPSPHSAARHPGRAAARDAGALSGEALAVGIIDAYPSPVARAYLALTEADPGAGAFGCLMDTFEGLVYFLAMVAVSSCQRSGLTLPGGQLAAGWCAWRRS